MATALVTQWKVIENDGTATLVDKQQFDYINTSIAKKIPMIQVGDHSVSIYDIKKIFPVKEKIKVQMEVSDYDWTGYTADILKAQYEFYIKGKARMRNKLKSLNRVQSGFTTTRSQEDYLRTQWDDHDVTYEEFVTQHNADAACERPNKYMTQFFWDDPYAYEEVGFMTEEERRKPKQRGSAFRD